MRSETTCVSYGLVPLVTSRPIDFSSTNEGSRPDKKETPAPAPREALIRTYFRTGSLESVKRAIGDEDNDGEVCALNEVLSSGETLMHLAVLANREDILLYLLQQGLAVDEPDAEGQTALHLAARECKLAMVKLLLQYDADPFLGQNSRFLPLSIAQGDGRVLGILMAACGRKMRKTHGSQEMGGGAGKHSWSEPCIPTLIPSRSPSPERPKPRARPPADFRTGTYPGRLPAVRIDYVGENIQTHDRRMSRSVATLPRGATERKSIRMRVDSFVSKTLRRRHSDRSKASKTHCSGQTEYEVVSGTSTLGRRPASKDMTPSLRYSPQLLTSA